VTQAEARHASERVADWLSRAPEYERCQRLAVYAELPGELAMVQVVARARSAGKRLIWPRIAAPYGLVFASVDRVEDLVRGRYGVREPRAGAPVESLGPDVLVLVPGVAFDIHGGRLGRGGGLWDRTLIDPRGATIFGVGYEFQVVERVPQELHDRPMDALLTEAWIRRCARP